MFIKDNKYSMTNRYDDENQSDDFDEGRFQKIRNAFGSKSILEQFGVDLTQKAEDGDLDVVVGRDNEINRIIQILGRRKKNNPILVGEAGVGKTAIIEGLAQNIANSTVSRVLLNKRIISLNMASLVAGTKYRGEFEERMKFLIDEITKSEDVIIYIDEIHTLVGAGSSSGQLDAANILKPALASGEIQCIGSTTLDEYRKHIEKDGALERRFQKVIVEATTKTETLDILKKVASNYEAFHNVVYTEKALEACINLTARYITERPFPDKALDVLDEAGARANTKNVDIPLIIQQLEDGLRLKKLEKDQAIASQQFELAALLRDEEKKIIAVLDGEYDKWNDVMDSNIIKVNEDHISEVIAMMTGVPLKRIAKNEGLRLLNMKGELSSRIIGQNAAVEKLAKAIQRSRAGLKDPNRPIGSFIFLGPTGVGKTELAKQLSSYLFDSDDALIRIDMSEYMDKFTVSRLVGAPPGYVGYDDAGQLTEKVRRKPYSVVLFDEIEKAHPDVFNILLQLLDDGQLTDSYGRRVDFKNTIVIMTSNIGSKQVRDFGRGIGFKSDVNKPDSKSIIDKALKNTFSPEFLNRVDEIISFNSLSREDIYKILDLELNKIILRLNAMGYKLHFTDELKDFIVNKAYDVNYGARPLRRVIQKYINNELSEAILARRLKKGNIEISLKEDKCSFLNL